MNEDYESFYCFRPLTGSRASEQVGGIVTKMVHGRFRPLAGSKVSELEKASGAMLEQAFSSPLEEKGI